MAMSFTYWIIPIHGFTREGNLPIQKHLKDATKLNRERMYKYAILTDNESLTLSRELIIMEKLGILATMGLDSAAREYIKNGVPLFEAELTDMRLTPKFSNNFTASNPPTEYQSIKIADFTKLWSKQLKQKNYDELYSTLIDLLENGALKEINQNCLTRHFVESIARSLLLMPVHKNMAKALSLKSPESLSLKFIKLQIRSLKWANSLDKRAFAIQSRDIPIFCQDVPAILYK